MTHSSTPAGFLEADGKIDYTFTNDYMFRTILQTNELVLKGLISALLHIPMNEIQSVEIKNPIKLGETLSSKDFILDIRVLLNNDTLINLEMQVNNHHNRTDRALSYLCRNFDQLYRGEKYETARPVIHIGILDFVLFPDAPEFYASYKMLNVKNHYVFNDKFTLNVLSLKETKLATKSLFEYNADDLIRQQCRAREEAERHERTLLKKVYSIWITIDTEDDRDSISKFSLKSETIFGKEKRFPELDKMCGVVIRIRENDDVEESKNMLIAMLEDMLRNEDCTIKKDKLKKKYGIKMTEELERRVGDMCNLSTVVEEKGIAQGKLMQLFELVQEGYLKEEDAAKKAGMTIEVFKKEMQEAFAS